MNSRRYGIGFFAGIFLLSLLYIFSDLRFQSAEEGVRAGKEQRIIWRRKRERSAFIREKSIPSMRKLLFR